MNIDTKILIGIIGFGLIMIIHLCIRFWSDREILSNLTNAVKTTNSNKKIKQYKQVRNIIQ
jgi:hypothetical protein